MQGIQLASTTGISVLVSPVTYMAPVGARILTRPAPMSALIATRGRSLARSLPLGPRQITVSRYTLPGYVTQRRLP